MAFAAEKPRYSRESGRTRAQLFHLREEEQQEAVESLSVFFRPVELYNILHDRAKKHPSFLQRCLHYKLQEKHKRRLEKPGGNVIFYYKYYHDMLETSEVTEDYACPFCMEKCACYKGLKCHLLASHYLFHYEFMEHQGYEDMIIFTKTNTRTSDIFGKMVHPRKDVFFFCRKPMRRQNANLVGPLALVSYMPSTVSGLRGASKRMDRVLYGYNVESASHSEPGSSIASTPLLRFAKSRRIFK